MAAGVPIVKTGVGKAGSHKKVIVKALSTKTCE